MIASTACQEKTSNACIVIPRGMGAIDEVPARQAQAEPTRIEARLTSELFYCRAAACRRRISASISSIMRTSRSLTCFSM